MAIEDAVTRGELFPSADTTTNGDDGDDRVMKGGDGIEERLGLYEKVSKSRVRRVRDMARVIASRKEERDFLEEYMGWLSSYDAVKHARGVLRDYEEEKKKREKIKGADRGVYFFEGCLDMRVIAHIIPC